MKIAAVIGGIAVSIIVLGGAVILCIAGLTVILKYIVPFLLLLALAKCLIDYLCNRQIAL